MRVSPNGLAAIRQYEGLRLDAYQDSVGVWTIGYGSTRYEDDSPVTQGDKLASADDADRLFRLTLRKYEDAVARSVLVPLTQPQFDALVSLTYNIGVGAFKNSTLLRKLNAHDYRGASSEFLRWNKAGGMVLHGLVRRRESEREMFLSNEVGQPPLTHLTPADPPPASKPMAPVLAALLPSLVSLIPELGKLFGSGSAVSERNVVAAQKVAEAVVAATGAPNLQGAVETISADPEARRKASEAVQGIWYELAEVGGGIKEARAFNVATAQIPAWRMPAVWVSGALLLLVFMVVGTVLWAPGWKDDIKLQVVTAVLTIIGMVGSFWLGTSASSQRKTDLMAEK